MEIRLGLWAPWCDDDTMLRFNPCCRKYLITCNQRRTVWHKNQSNLKPIEHDNRREGGVKCSSSTAIIESVFLPRYRGNWRGIPQVFHNKVAWAPRELFSGRDLHSLMQCIEPERFPSTNLNFHHDRGCRKQRENTSSSEFLLRSLHRHLENFVAEEEE